jgi:hypothetical protein
MVRTTTTDQLSVAADPANQCVPNRPNRHRHATCRHHRLVMETLDVSASLSHAPRWLLQPCAHHRFGRGPPRQCSEAKLCSWCRSLAPQPHQRPRALLPLRNYLHRSSPPSTPARPHWHPHCLHLYPVSPGADSRPVLPGLQPGARPISCGSMFHKNGIKTIDGPIAPPGRIQPNSSFP